MPDQCLYQPPGFLSETDPAGTVSSITMPHKRDPETAEHLVTLSRLARANASVLLEGMVTEHERDGPGWKAEWPAFNETCLLAGAALAAARALLAGLRVHPEAMRCTIDRQAGYLRRWPRSARSWASTGRKPCCRTHWLRFPLAARPTPLIPAAARAQTTAKPPLWPPRCRLTADGYRPRRPYRRRFPR